MIDYNIRFIAFPNRAAKAAVFPADDGSFDIYINTLYPECEWPEALLHELEHLRLNHLYRPITIKQAEAEVNRAKLQYCNDVFETNAGFCPAI